MARIPPRREKLMKTQLKTTLIALAALLAACGKKGPYGTGGNGSGVAAARITRGAVMLKSAGAITVTGIRLSTSGATVKVDDHPGGLDDVRPGDVVTVKGSFDDRTGTAAEIEVEHAIEGQVEAKGADFLVVGGVRIQVDDATHFGPDHPSGIDSVFVGSVVAVSGTPVAGVSGAVDDRGGLRASRIDRSSRDGGDPSDDADLEVKGFVSALDPVARSFQLRVTPDAASYYLVGSASLPDGLVDGAYVEVATTVAPVPGTPPVLATLTASALHLEDRLEGAKVELEGFVTSTSGSTFVVAGVTVATSGATTFVLGLPSDLAVGVEVEVEGAVDGSGVLQASKVTVEAGVRVTAPVEGYTGTDMILLGVPVQIPAWVRNDLSVALANGVRVEVRGSRTAGGNGVVAWRITDPSGGGGGGGSSRVFVRAVADAKGADTVTVLGFSVSLPGASLQGADGSATSLPAFLDAVEPGHTVLKVRASSAASVNRTTMTWAADEVEIEGHD
jgi:hypothetical protein